MFPLKGDTPLLMSQGFINPGLTSASQKQVRADCWFGHMPSDMFRFEVGMASAWADQVAEFKSMANAHRHFFAAFCQGRIGLYCCFFCQLNGFSELNHEKFKTFSRGAASNRYLRKGPMADSSLPLCKRNFDAALHGAHPRFTAIQ